MILEETLNFYLSSELSDSQGTNRCFGGTENVSGSLGVKVDAARGVNVF